MAEVLHGNASSNQLNATADKTQVYGLAGNDTLVSDSKSNVILIGGSGDDSLIMSGGNGTLSGGDGSDTFELDYSATQTLSAVIEDLVPSEDKIVVNFDGNTAPQLTSSISGSDVVWRDGNGNFNLTLKGVRDNDYFDGTGDTEKDNRIFDILKLTNDERENPTKVEGHESITAEAKNLPWLTLSDGLSKAASIRAEEIAELGASGILDIYKHTRPDNKSEWYTVFDDGRVGKHYPNNGENITAGASTASGAMKDLIGSLSHHKNILNIQPETDLPIDYRKLGVGYEFVPEVEVDSNGKRNHYYRTQLFGGSLSAGEMETVSTADLLTANPEVHTISTAVTLTEGNDTYSNSVFSATIAALGGNDSITNSGLKVSISGGEDNDTIDNRGSFGTINAGAGNDSINLNAAQEVLIQYAAGDGSDTVSGINSSDTVSISSGEYTPVTVGNDIVVSLGADSITLSGAARSNVQIVGTRSKLYLGTEGDDTIKADVNGATIQPLGGNDSITNDGGANVLFVHESGNDTIGGFNSTSTLQIAGGSYDSFASGNDLILRSGADSINILNGAYQTINIVDAEGNPVTVGDAKNIRGTEQADNLSNDLDGATIRAFGGDDTITNSGEKVSIYGGAGNDSANNNQRQRTVYIYESGDDTIEGFNDSDTLNIGGYTSDTEKSGNDVIVKIINGSVTVGTVTLKDYTTGQEVNITSTGSNPGKHVFNVEEDSVSIIGTDGDDDLWNRGNNVTITGLAGNDSIYNDPTSGEEGNNVTIDGGTGNDRIRNGGDFVTIDGGAGNDFIYNYISIQGDETISPENVTISGGTGDDSIDNRGENILIDASAGNDTVWNYGDSVTIDGGVNDDHIRTGEYGSSVGANVSISAGDGNDAITAFASNVTINGGDGNDNIINENSADNNILNGDAGDDVIYNNDSDSVTISGGTGNDGIINFGLDVIIDAGLGNDTIENSGTNVSMLGGAGDDRISLYADSRNNYIRYDLGDGNDTIWGITGNDTVNLPEVAELNSANSRITSLSNPEDDLIIRVRTNGVITGEISLVGGMKHPPHFTFGQSNTSNGSIGNDSDGHSASGNDGNGDDKGKGGNTSSGTSSNADNNSDASGSKSAIGSAGNQTSKGISNSGRDGGRVSSRVSSRVSTNRKDSIASAATRSLYNEMTAMNQTTSLKSDYIYTGGNQVISDYTPDKKIFFCEIYTGAFYDAAGNFFAGSSTGALAVENAMDKVIDLRDAAGNDFVKAYAATTAGLIDGRGIAGFELINGSAGADAIYAGDGGSQLWGGADVATDILVGGGGSDIFIVSKYQGADLIVNASSKDVVYLSDANLSDIIATEENNGVVAVAFNTGNVVAVQSSEALSSTFLLNDGSQYRYNHANKSWQSA